MRYVASALLSFHLPGLDFKAHRSPARKHPGEELDAGLLGGCSEPLFCAPSCGFPPPLAISPSDHPQDTVHWLSSFSLQVEVSLPNVFLTENASLHLRW